MKTSRISYGDCGTRTHADRTLRLFCCVLFLLLTGVGSVFGAEVEVDAGGELTELPLESLLDVSVVSASRKTQALADVTSAVFVISQEDIRHSGATTIPDLLRMVPGVQVASIDGTSWAVSIRGFGGTFANKLLVMIDGRSVYTPLFGGVFWDVQDTLIDNIERIEVIRGSGGTMWGANAVNGVINIITKNSQDTKGGMISGLIGNRERGTVEVRYGAAIGDSTSYRLFVKHLDRGDSYATTGSADDSMQITRGGFRMDSTPGDKMHLTLQGDLYGGTVHNTVTIPSSTPPFTSTVSQPTDLFGGNFLSRVDWLQSESSKFSLQLYYDRTSRNLSLVKEDRDTVDLDLQHNLRLGKMNELTWGAGYRFLHDQTAGTKGALVLTPDKRSDNLFNMFVQDEITLLPERLRITLGSKLEHNEYTGWELQPSARLLWTPRKGYSVWAAVTRSVRTPTRAEQDAEIGRAFIPVAPPPLPPLPTAIALVGNRSVKAETLLAYELGFRADLSEVFSVDISSFYNRYRDIIGTQPGTPIVQGGTQVLVPLNIGNFHTYDSSGGEISLQWQPREWWKIKGGYSFIRFFGNNVYDSQAAKATPTHQATLRSMLAIGRDIDFDLWARYVDDNRYALDSGVLVIPAYIALDSRLAWRPMAGVELSVVGQNLLTNRHLETASDLTVIRHEVGRSVYGKVIWAF